MNKLGNRSVRATGQPRKQSQTEIGLVVTLAMLLHLIHCRVIISFLRPLAQSRRLHIVLSTV